MIRVKKLKLWIREDYGYGITTLTCPCCHTEVSVDAWGRDAEKWNFCPCCGEPLEVPEWVRSKWEDMPE